MFNPSYDRTEWRSRYTHELIAAAKESGHELAIALGERLHDLADVEEQLQGMTAERDELDKRVTLLLTELNELHEALKCAGIEAD